MKINKIKISNILGIESLTFELGKFTEISGKNGAGKTSVLESLKGALKGGNDATLLRNGETQGEVVLVLDDGSNIIRTIKNGKSNLRVISGLGINIEKPQTTVDNLIDILSVNPVQFLLSDKKSRTKLMLDTLDLKVTREQIGTAIDDFIAPIDVDRNALEVINELHTEIFDSRRIYNRESTEKRNSINQLQESMVEIDFDPEELSNQIIDLEEKKEQRIIKKAEFLKNIQDESQDKLEKLRLQYEASKDEILQSEKARIAQLNSSYEETMQPLLDNLSQLKERLKFSGATLKTKELIKQYTNEAEHIQNLSNECSEKLKNLEALKLTLLSALPIQGLEVKEGEIYKDGVIFDRLNTAEQIKIAVELAKLRAGNLGIVCIDGLERFDSETFELFKTEMMKTDLQTIITRVSDTELEINN